MTVINYLFIKGNFPSSHVIYALPIRISYGFVAIEQYLFSVLEIGEFLSTQLGWHRVKVVGIAT